jgi:hypothetical protein
VKFFTHTRPERGDEQLADDLASLAADLRAKLERKRKAAEAKDRQEQREAEA